MLFGNILRQLRKEKDLSQLELSEALNISSSSISMYERNERVPELDTFEAIADYFNVDMDYLKGKSKIRRKYVFVDDDNFRVENIINDFILSRTFIRGIVSGYRPSKKLFRT